MEKIIAKGKDAIVKLSEIYQQLYIKPIEETPDKYKKIVLQGENVEDKDLSHFIFNEKDSLSYLTTPVGEIMTLVLHERNDFETFMQIMANKCMPSEIPSTQGASILDGVINWTKINNHLNKWKDEQIANGVSDPDDSEEFKKFVSVKSNYLDALIVLSCGPYSNIDAKELNMPQEKWLEDSLSIRKYHECTHFFCRRMYPEKIDAIWDELVADAEGIYDTYGRFVLAMEELFLGINENGYTKGRLINYVKDEDINELAIKCHKILCQFEKIAEENKAMQPFEFARILEERKETLYK